MFCPNCGQQNLDGVKFCRKCGTNLDNVSGALVGAASYVHPLNKKGKPIYLESAVTKIFTGLAFLAVAIALAFSQTGRGWWFWMLIPAFGSLGSGVAQYLQLRRSERGMPIAAGNTPQIAGRPADQALPPRQTEPASVEYRYKTGDLVPPSVTDNTTRHLSGEERTIQLPKD